MSIQLQVGKSYKNRLGEVVVIIEKDDDDTSLYQYTDGNLWYTESGDFFGGWRSDEDLIEEYTNEKEQFKFELDDVIVRDKVSYIVIGRYKDMDSDELFYTLTCVSALPDVDVPIEQVHEQFKIVS